MVKAAVIFGVLLIGNGLYGYLESKPDAVSESDNNTESDNSGGPEGNSKSRITAITALIPAFVGIVIVICGLGSAISEGLKKHLMHFSAVVALLGAIASGGRLIMKFGEASSLSQFNQALMAVLCIGYLIACIRSFRAARKRREEAAAAS